MKMKKIPLLIMMTLIVFLFACKNSNIDKVTGTWKVTDGRNKDAIFEFTQDNRLYIYCKNYEQANWYGFSVVISKKPLNETHYTTTTSSNLGIPFMQGEIHWDSKNKISLITENKANENTNEIMLAKGPIYMFTEITNDKLKIEEMQYSIKDGDKEPSPQKVGEMVLKRYNVK